MPMASAQPAEHRRSRWIPYSFFGFFGVVLAVNGVMLAYALGTFNGLSVDGAYDRGLNYNETLAEFETQRALGWDLDVAFAPDESRAGDLMVSAHDRAGNPLHQAAITASLIRPTQEGSDFTVALTEGAAGTYAAPIQLPLPGQWQLRLDIVHEDDSYRLERRISVP